MRLGSAGLSRVIRVPATYIVSDQLFEGFGEQDKDGIEAWCGRAPWALHRLLKQATARPPASNMLQQQDKFVSFMQEYNCERHTIKECK